MGGSDPCQRGHIYGSENEVNTALTQLLTYFNVRIKR
jgi:hypothetical protein